MLDVTEAIENRRSIRQYTDAPISQDTMDRLISLAVKAPTGSGMEPWDSSFCATAPRSMPFRTGPKKRSWIIWRTTRSSPSTRPG